MVNHVKMKNRKLRIPGIGSLLILFAFLILPGMAAPVFAEPVWSGNASVDAAEFVNFLDDFPLAGASSSFTRNTQIIVTNPQNGKTVTVTIVKRAPRPGVFLVLSEEAGKALSFPIGQVIPVQVQVAPSPSSSEYDEFKSKDPDINPAVSVPVIVDTPVEDSISAPGAADAVPEETLAAEDAGTMTAPTLFGDEPVPVPVPLNNLRLDPGDAPEEIIPEDHDAVDLVTLKDPIDIPVETDLDEALDLTSVEETGTDLLPKGDNIIYFLTPSDFRPPTGPVPVKGEEEEIVPVLVDRSELKDFIVNQLNNGSSYIQLGAYSNSESIYNEISAIEARYPMVVWTENRSGNTLYKLLIGPLTKDETGVLSYRFRDSGYADLFLYKP